MRIAVLTPAEASVFQTLRLQGLQECPTAFASSYEEECHTPPGAVAKRLEPHEGGGIMGAFAAGGLVGMVGVQREKGRKCAHKAYLWGMYVSPPARMAGVGRALVDRALSYAADPLRVAQVNLGVNVSNVAAIALYERVGFKQFGLERDFMRVDGQPQDEIHMVCVLGEKR